MTTRVINGQVGMSQTMRASAAECENKVLNRILLVFLVLGLVSIAVFMGLVVYWRSEIDKMQQRVTKLDECIDCEQRLIENHRNKKEELCSFKNINQKIKDYKMDLRPTECSQTIYVKKNSAAKTVLADVRFPNEKQEEQVVVANAQKTSSVVVQKNATQVAKNTPQQKSQKVVVSAKNVKSNNKVTAKQQSASYAKNVKKQGGSYAVYHQ